jgi:hypothetical protein
LKFDESGVGTGIAKARRMHGYCVIGEEAFVAWNGCNCAPKEEVDNEADRIH